MKKETELFENKSKRWMERIVRALPLIVLLLMILGAWILFKKIETKRVILKEKAAASLNPQKPQANVVALKISYERLRDRIRFPGITLPAKQVKVLAEVKGRVVRKRAKEGQRIRDRDIIVALETRDYENALFAARASHEAALAALKRIRMLFQKNAVSQSRLDDALARVRNLKAHMDNAALALERCTVRAPFDGVLNRIYVHEGDFVGVGDPIAEVLQMDRLKVQVGIPESDVEAVRRKDTFLVTVDALGGKAFEARKAFLSKRADPMARLYDLNLILNNPSHEILPDMFVRVEVVKKEIPKGIAVPLYAVVNRNAENVVFVVNDARVHARKVALGLVDGWKVQVKAGLKPGDRVIVVGHRDVNPGQRVTVVKTLERIEDLLP